MAEPKRETRVIPLGEIDIDESLLPRIDVDEATLDRYAEIPSASFPPLIVFQIGSRYTLAGGLHRLQRHVREGLVQVACEVRYGSDGDLIEAAILDNARHGLPLTRKERRRAIELLLQDPEKSKLSDRAIAEICGCSDKTVGKVRAESAKASQPAQDDNCGNSAVQVETRTGRDGKSRRVRSQKSSAVEGTDEPADELGLDSEPAGKLTTTMKAGKLKVSQPIGRDKRTRDVSRIGKGAKGRSGKAVQKARKVATGAGATLEHQAEAVRQAEVSDLIQGLGEWARKLEPLDYISKDDSRTIDEALDRIRGCLRKYQRTAVASPARE